MSGQKKNKSILFTTDAIFAGLIIVIALTAFSENFIYEDKTPDLSYLSYDLVKSFSSIKTYEMNSSYLKELTAIGVLNNTNNTILEAIGELYVLNKTLEAGLLSENISKELIPSKYGFAIFVNDELVYTNGKPVEKSVISAKRLISGIEKYKPIRGSTSKVFLEGINKKTMKEYVYFGGFVGQGNISRFTDNIPDDGNVTEMYMEFDVGHSFSLTINNQSCPSSDYIFNKTVPYMQADAYNISFCKDKIISGERNNFKLVFNNPELNESYVGGGFVRITYTTKELYSATNTGEYKYYFPEIFGLINLYSSFYIPGNVSNVDIYLHYFFNHTDNFNKTFYLKIGNTTIYEDKNSTEEINAFGHSFGLDDSTIRTLLDYGSLSTATVPIRIGAHNMTGKDVMIGNADIALITDYSGSMKKTPDDWSQGNSGGGCDSLDYTKRKTLYAKCADQDFVTYVLQNFSQNRVWPVWLNNDAIGSYEANPSSYSNVYANVVPSGQGDGKTCLACALNKAYNILNANIDPAKAKFIVLMSDAVPTHCPADSCINGNSTEYGTQICEGICDISGACDVSLINSQCTACTSNQSAINATLYSAQRLVNDFGVIIYTIGFGPVNDCSASGDLLRRIAEIGNGTFQNTTNITQLYNIYKNISDEIILRINQTSQTIYVEGSIEPTKLFGDSYINVNYTPITSPPGFGEIELSIEEKLKNCTYNISIPAEVRVIDAKATSYSAEHWTDYVDVDNNTVYFLGDYSSNYVTLGDPFIVQIPNTFLSSGAHNISMGTGDTVINSFNCSLNNTLIMRGMIQSAVTYSDVLEKAVGCKWNIDFDDGSNIVLNVPPEYNGTKTCYYTSLNISYDANDTYDDAMFRLMDQLDFDDNGKIFVNLDENNFIINAISVQKVPYPWGPAIAEVRIWQ